MRSPVLIAETPFAGGNGPRLLVPPGRGVDSGTAAHFIDRARDVDEDDVEEIEGDDYLAVRLPLKNPETEEVAHDFMLLAGIDVDRMTGEERDEWHEPAWDALPRTGLWAEGQSPPTESHRSYESHVTNGTHEAEHPQET